MFLPHDKDAKNEIVKCLFHFFTVNQGQDYLQETVDALLF